MPFTLTILGSNSAVPAYGRHHTAQFLTVEGQHFLIDCGEGTQMQCKKYKVKSSKIDHVFISHLHGDHYLGLVGFISSLHLHGRTKDLHIYGPKGLSEIILVQLKYSETILKYKVVLHEIEPDKHKIILETKGLTISTIPHNHRIPCCGFLFQEKEKPFRLIKEKLPEDLSIDNIGRLKKGMDAVDDEGNIIIKRHQVTRAPRKQRSYAYCSDTLYEESLAKVVSGVNLLYHEATFLDEKEIWASSTFHSTAKQAGLTAKNAAVDQLIIGHFSARYRDLTPFLEEAKSVFKNANLALEGKEFSIQD